LRWFFVYSSGVQLQRPKPVPAILAALVIALVCVLRVWNPDLIDRQERATYDLRVRLAQSFPAPVATNLAFVAMEDSTIAAIRNGLLGRPYGLYWPRHVYGRIVEELAAQGAKAVAFDVIFAELRPDHAPVNLADGNLVESDDFFAAQMRLASNTVIAVTPEIYPPRLFATNAFAHGDISAEKDSEGILRRARAFFITRRWHPLIADAAQKFGVNATNISVQKNKVVLVADSGESKEIPLDENGEMLLKKQKIKVKPFTDERVWHMGIVLAARELNLDLDHADVDLPHGKIILRGAGGVERTIPVDDRGYFYVDWRLTPSDPRVVSAPIEAILTQDIARLNGQTNGLRDDFKNRIVVVGSAAQGNDLTDRGATPLENNTLLVSKHWNVANSVITGNFIHRTALASEIVIIIFLGLITAFLTWQFRAFAAAGGTLLLTAVYIFIAFAGFVKFRLWLPIAYPIIGAVFIEHLTLLVHRAVFEEDEKRRVKSIFSKLVSPNVVNELLAQEKLELAGSRRELTVFFADVRGFTALTDQMQERVAEFVRTKNLEGDAAEKCFAESARETLEIVNTYLSTVADAVKTHGGTLDKYIGDCVMAFWNSPISDDAHALNCVRAAIHAQKAIADLNVKRLAQNPERAAENAIREAAGLPPRPPLSELFLGTGINTGTMTVGLLGSNEHGFNYSVFGREVNLASRLEGVSGTGRIIVGAATFRHLQKHDPELAARCVEQTPVTPKGFRDPVRIFEVPWK
jgi:class 3 adenylate cyclase/CHASE2 domain-containing sensor protein